ncbi:MAG: TetR/AcrR family transcriptional regulator [Bacilli bacterium]|nr:TetR/AcrR family transcriptional regulator [Bacilli bacterium]
MENKKEKVNQTAKLLFAQKGYKKVSMDEIASKSSVTKRTIYTYYKDKDELFKYFINEELENLRKIVESIEKKELSFFDKIHETLYQLLKYKKQSEFLNTISKEAIEIKTSPVITYLKVINDSIQDYIKQKLELAIKNGYVKECDVDICSFLICKLYIAILFEWNSANKEINEKEIIDNISRLLKTGIFN